MFPMSWGSATIYISQKTTDPFGDPADAVEEAEEEEEEEDGAASSRSTINKPGRGEQEGQQEGDGHTE